MPIIENFQHVNCQISKYVNLIITQNNSEEGPTEVTEYTFTYPITTDANEGVKVQ